MKALTLAALPAAMLFAVPANAQLGTLNQPAPGYSSILNSDYATAEKEIRNSSGSAYDPARAINLGVVMAKTGHKDEAAKQFQGVLLGEDVELVVADGKTVMAHDLARFALASLQSGALSR